MATLVESNNSKKRKYNEMKGNTSKGKMKKNTSREERSLKYKKFIGSKAEGQGFADKRKRQAMYQYRKMESRDRQDLQNWSKRLKTLYDNNTSEDEEEEHRPKKKKKLEVKGSPQNLETALNKKPKKEEPKSKISVFHKEQKLQEEKRLQQEEKKKEIERKAKEREEARDKYEKEKKRKHKVLMKKNFKGQPNMSARMDLLLEKIEKQIRT